VVQIPLVETINYPRVSTMIIEMFDPFRFCLKNGYLKSSSGLGHFSMMYLALSGLGRGGVHNHRAAPCVI